MVDPHNFEQFARAFMRISTKKKRLIRFRWNALQRDYWRNHTDRDLVLKPRQVGFSTLLQAENYWRVTTSAASTLTLGKDAENTQMLRRMFQRYHDKLLTDPKPAKRLDNDTLSTFPDYESEALIATAGNTGSGRGASLTFVHGSEVAFWKDAELLVAGALQAGNPRVVLESTPNGASGYFYETAMGALDGKNDWRLHFWEWFRFPPYQIPLDPGEHFDLEPEEIDLIERLDLSLAQIKWRRKKRRELKHLFLQEYPEDVKTCFLLSGQGYFGNVDHVYIPAPQIEPLYAHRYVGGLDFGQVDDYTALSIFDTTARVEVELMRVNKLPWREIRRRVIDACKRWNVSEVHAEQNSMGETNIEAIREEARDQQCETRFIPFETNAATKSPLLTEFYVSLHERGLKLLNDPQGKREIAAFVAKLTKAGNWQFAAAGVEKDDTVIARAAANKGISNPTGAGFGSAPNVLSTRR